MGVPLLSNDCISCLQYFLSSRYCVMTELLNFRTSGLLYLLTEVSFFFVLNRSENRIPAYNPLFLPK